MPAIFKVSRKFKFNGEEVSNGIFFTKLLTGLTSAKNASHSFNEISPRSSLIFFLNGRSPTSNLNLDSGKITSQSLYLATGTSSLSSLKICPKGLSIF